MLIECPNFLFIDFQGHFCKIILAPFHLCPKTRKSQRNTGFQHFSSYLKSTKNKFQCSGSEQDFSVWPFRSGRFRSSDISVCPFRVWGHVGHDISVHKQLITFVYLNDYMQATCHSS